MTVASLTPPATPDAVGDPRQQTAFIHLWSGFYYGEMAAQELSIRLADMAPDPQLQHFSAHTHHDDETWHAEVFRDLVTALPTAPAMPPAPAWAEEIIQQVRTCDSYTELTIGSLVVEASAVFLLELQADFPGELGRTFHKMLLQEKGHVAFATRYLRDRLRATSGEERRQLKSLILESFRYMRDAIRPEFVRLHLEPVLPLLGISTQDYRDRARLDSRAVVRSMFR